MIAFHNGLRLVSHLPGLPSWVGMGIRQSSLGGISRGWHLIRCRFEDCLCIFKNCCDGNSLVVQWLGPHGLSALCCWGPCCKAKKKKKKRNKNNCCERYHLLILIKNGY